MLSRKVKNQETIEVQGPAMEPGKRWQPIQGSETTDLLQNLGIPDSNRVVEESARILSKCIPPTDSVGSETGLVIGYVQSGKTLSFTTVAALARDNGYQLVIVITGTSVPLLTQSTDRLIKDFRLSTRKDRKWQRFTNPTPNSSDVTNMQNTLADWDDDSVGPEERRTVLITVMKNGTHLDNLIEVLRSLSLDARPAIVIDDEADQAGLNNSVRKGKESATYQRLLQLRRALPHHTYLQYTATPQAPLLINLIDALSPRFAELLTPGADYVGGRDFFIDEPRLVHTVPESEIPSSASSFDSPPESLMQALRIFFLGVSAGFLREQGYGNRSMLVHPSRGKFDHGQYYNWIRAVMDRWVITLNLPASDPDREDLLTEFRTAYDDLQETVHDLPAFDDLVDRLQRSIRRTTLEEVNTRIGETPKIEWTAAYPHIVVGGQAMDRGFTVEGLTVTYMPRGIGVANADNVQQRARFFGYKRRYLGYCRVYLEETARAAYTSYVRHEEDVRARLEAHNEEGKPLTEWKREFFLTSQLKPTRKSVLGLDYMRISLGDKWWFPRMPHDTMQTVQTNREVVERFLASVTLHPDSGHAGRSQMMTHEVNENVPLGKVFDSLLTQYVVTSLGDSQKFTALRIIIQDYLEDKPDALCMVYYMSKGLVRTRSTEDDGSVDFLFQGPYPDSRGSVYPGDKKIKSADGLTLQIHRLKVVDGNSAIEGVPAIALWIPAEIAQDLVIQEQPLSV